MGPDVRRRFNGGSRPDVEPHFAARDGLGLGPPRLVFRQYRVGAESEDSNCSVDTGSDNTLWIPGMWTLSSRHAGGANVLLTDGSVRFLKDSSNLQTVWALGSRAQGEVISADSY